LSSFNDFLEIVRDLYLVPFEVGQVVKLNNLFFKQASSELLVESFVELERWVQILEQKPEMKIELGGQYKTVN
jgi:hypothetical protein